jgi:transposase-like protein
MVKSPQRNTLAGVLPLLVDGIQVNFCRNPRCKNFGVPPRVGDIRRGQPGHYHLDPSGRDGYKLRRALCNRLSVLFTNAGIAIEVDRLRTANGLLRPDSCPTKSCANTRLPVSSHPKRYYRHGQTSSGRPRWRCRACKKAFTIEDDVRKKTAGDVNGEIVRDLVNRASLNAILRKTQISPTALYDRIDLIHRQMIAFEAFKVRRLLRTDKKHRKHFALATDAQDQWGNWESQDRRFGVSISTLSTADNYSGFIFRTDTSFDPTTGDVVAYFKQLLGAGDFEVPGNLGISRRLQRKAFLEAVAFAVQQRRDDPPTLEDLDLMAALKRLRVALRPELQKPRNPDPLAQHQANPVNGAVISPVYTAMAHFILVNEMLPRDAIVHLMTDTGGQVTPAAPSGFITALKENRADLTYVYFEKGLKTPHKQQIMGEFNAKLRKFKAEGDPYWGPKEIRIEFMRAFARKANRNIVPVPAEWWKVPIETMYEPHKIVGISHQRQEGAPAQMQERKFELLTRSSLHSVDSFFNVLRQRVSYLHRPGQSRSTDTFYNQFQAYRPAMIQKIVDISRVWFNWCEPRPFRIARKFDSLHAIMYDTSHSHLEEVSDENKRKTKRERMSTPAMRIGLTRSPVRLDVILYRNWPRKLLTPVALPKDR